MLNLQFSNIPLEPFILVREQSKKRPHFSEEVATCCQQHAIKQYQYLVF